MDAFKIPTAIPQDLLLIHGLIGAQEPAPQPQTTVPALEVPSKNEDEGISSSDDENLSEEEIAADLITGANTDDDDLAKIESKPLSDSSTSETSSDESDSDSDSDSDVGTGAACVPRVELDLDDDEDPIPTPGTNTYFQTKHEIQEVEVPIPEVDEVGSDEVLEKVGEIMNIIDRVAIVRGLPAPSENGMRGSDKALDSDTLLAFDDRKVMGYIYETFGPTSQPLYQVKFSTAFPLDPEKVRVGREVFHVPVRSRFVFVNQIKVIKGSDASNVHDEEPADDELEFSDDEAEAAYRSRLKRKRGESRARSVAPSSRASTPNPTLMRDQEFADEAILSRGAYDEHGPYDIDYSVPGPSSRPAPIPYDDPYGDAYTAPDLADREAPAADASIGSQRRSFDRSARTAPSAPSRADRDERAYDGRHGRGRDRDRGRGGRGRDRDRDRGRGSGGDRGGRGGRGSQQNHQGYGLDSSSSRTSASYADASYDSRGESNRSLSPTSLAIARATGQAPVYPQQQQEFFNPQQPQFVQHQQQYGMLAGEAAQQWGYMQKFMPQYGGGSGGAYMRQGYQYPTQHHQQQSGYNDFSAGMHMPGVGPQGAPFVQPHINPRFASAFGLGLPQTQTQAAYGAGAGVNSSPAAMGGTVPAFATSLPSPAPPSSSVSANEWAVPVHSGLLAPTSTPNPNSSNAESTQK